MNSKQVEIAFHYNQLIMQVLMQIKIGVLLLISVYQDGLIQVHLQMEISCWSLVLQ